MADTYFQMVGQHMNRRLQPLTGDPCFSKDTLNRAFGLAYLLHPDRTTAVRIVLQTLRDFPAILRKTNQLMPFEETNLQLYLFAVSERLEKDQESHPDPQKRNYRGNTYCPSAEDRLIRYVKHLVSRIIATGMFFTAVGLGHHLFRFRHSPHHNLQNLENMMPSIVPLKRYPNHYPGTTWKTLDKCILRTADSLRNALQNRFSTDYGKIIWNAPSPHEAKLISNILKHFRPWETDCLESGTSILDVVARGNFDDERNVNLERKLVHALIDTECGGFKELIQEYQRRHEPAAVWDTYTPNFPGGLTALPGEGRSDRFNPGSLTDTEAHLIWDSCAYIQRRRQQVVTSVLDIRVDGEKLAQLDPAEARSASFHISPFASHCEIYGQDNDGAFLLVSFPLIHLQHGDSLRMKLKSGQRLRLDVKVNETSEQFEMNLTCRKAPLLWSKMFMRYLGRWCEQSAFWLGGVYRYRWVPVGSTCLILILLFSTAWLGILNLSQRSEISQPGQWRGAPRVEPARFLLKFDETITERHIRTLLLEIEAKFVAGPSSGYYMVESGRAVEEVIKILDEESQIEEYTQVTRP